MKRTEFVVGIARNLIDRGMDNDVALDIAELTWNMTKWQLQTSKKYEELVRERINKQAQ